MARFSNIVLGSLCAAGSISGQAQAAMDGIFAFDKWSLNRTSLTSNAHSDQNGTDGFTLSGNTSGIGRRSNDRFFANVQSIGNITGQLTVTKTRPNNFDFSFDGSGPAYKLSYDYTYNTTDRDGSQFDSASCLSCKSIFSATPGSVQGHVDFSSAVDNQGHVRYGGSVFSSGGNSLNLNLFGPGFSLFESLAGPDINQTQTYDFTLGTSQGLNIFANIVSDGLDGGATLKISNFTHEEGTIPFAFHGSTGGFVPIPSTFPLLLSSIGALGYFAHLRRRRAISTTRRAQ